MNKSLLFALLSFAAALLLAGCMAETDEQAFRPTPGVINIQY